MVFRDIKFQISIRVLFLLFNCLLISYLIIGPAFYFTAIFFCVLLIWQIYSLIGHINRTHDDLNKLLNAIKYDDFTMTFNNEGDDKQRRELYNSFNNVIAAFRKINHEREEQKHFLDNIVQQVKTGLIVFDHQGNILLMNVMTKRLLKMNHLRNIHEIEKTHKELKQVLINLEHNKQEVVNFEANDEDLQVAVRATKFNTREKQLTLVSLQNIGAELDEKEQQAWQDLVRVLTHEIMNSITPITSLASTVKDSLEELQLEKPEDERLGELMEAMSTIERRSVGLMTFVKNYRSLVHIPRPEFIKIEVEVLLKNVCTLLKPELEKKGISVEKDVQPGMRLIADRAMLEQVIINLLLNSIAGLENIQNPVIKLKAFVNGESRPVLQVIDNGRGISEEVKKKIFIPFFSTSKNGSGVGLSVTKQIMRLHKGNIMVQSEPGIKTTVSLKF